VYLIRLDVVAHGDAGNAVIHPESLQSHRQKRMEKRKAAMWKGNGITFLED
jgi:hypothetical protein